MRVQRHQIGLYQSQLTGACDCFGATLDPELAKDFMRVAFHGPQHQKKPLTNLLIGKSLSDEPKDFQLAWAEWLDQGLGRGHI
jgi:hypothetical protein